MDGVGQGGSWGYSRSDSNWKEEKVISRVIKKSSTGKQSIYWASDRWAIWPARGRH